MRKISISMLALVGVIGFAGAANAAVSSTNVASKGYVDAKDTSISNSMDSFKKSTEVSADGLSVLTTNTVGQNLTAIDTDNTVKTDGSYIKTKNKVYQNLTALDTQVNANTSDIDTNAADIDGIKAAYLSQTSAANTYQTIENAAKAAEVDTSLDNWLSTIQKDDTNYPTLGAVGKIVEKVQNGTTSAIADIAQTNAAVMTGEVTGTVSQVNGKVTSIATTIADSTVDSANIVDGTIENADIKADTIEGSRLNTSSCAAGQVLLYNGTEMTCEDVVYWDSTANSGAGAATNSKPAA